MIEKQAGRQIQANGLNKSMRGQTKRRSKKKAIFIKQEYEEWQTIKRKEQKKPNRIPQQIEEKIGKNAIRLQIQKMKEIIKRIRQERVQHKKIVEQKKRIVKIVQYSGMRRICS